MGRVVDVLVFTVTLADATEDVVGVRRTGVTSRARLLDADVKCPLPGVRGVEVGVLLLVRTPGVYPTIAGLSGWLEVRHLAVQEAVVVVLASLQEGEFYDASRTVGSVANEGRVEYREVQRPQRR